jgi:tRNA C32,U32 (ribose-2'-O)-methylase TrmJ
VKIGPFYFNTIIFNAVKQNPHAGDFESLNVSVATGVVLYEVAKQRTSK